MREHCRHAINHALDGLGVLHVFGSDPADAEPQAGALSFTDARILAFPVRSARGVFAWVTCPAVLERFHRDQTLISAPMADNQLPAQRNIQEGLAIRGSDDLVIQSENQQKIVLEEYDYSVSNNSPWQAYFNRVSQWIAANGLDESTQERFKSHLVLIPDDEFGHYVKHATEVVARIGLDSETKTVKRKALFYEEFLPPETILYSVVVATAPRMQNAGNAIGVLNYLSNQIAGAPFIQIGGNETTGKGFCLMKLAPFGAN